MTNKEKNGNDHHFLTKFHQDEILSVLVPLDPNSKQKKADALNKASLLTLHQAARDGQVKTVENYLSQYGKDRRKVNKKDEEETTALHYAVRYGHFNIVKLLVENGASVNIQGEYGATPLHYAARYMKKTDIEQMNIENKEPSATIQKYHSLSQIEKFGMLHGSKKNLSKVPKFDISKKSIKRKIHGSFDEFNLLYVNNFIDSNIKTLYSEPSVVFHSKRHNSFHYGYENTNKKEGNSAVVILGDLSQQEMANMKSVDALILPPIKNVSFSEVELDQNSSRISTVVSAANISSDYNFPVNNCSEHISASNNSFDQVSFENVSSADINAKEKLVKKKPYLFKRKRNNNKAHQNSILMYLIEQKANINSKDFNGSTPLHYAAMRGNAVAVEMLLMQKNINIEATDQSKMTPLHCASSAGSFDVCHLLLEHGAKIICQDKENMTPLHFAAMEGHLDVVQLLFDYAESRGGITLIAKLIFSADQDEQSALHLAVENNHIDIVKFCINKGSNVNLVKANMNSPLHLACTSGFLEIAKLLIENGAVIESKNSLQETPLHRAALFNRTEIIEFLLDKGADVNCRDKDNETPLLMAVRKNNVEAVKVLLRYSADPNVKDANDKTCLFIAAEHNSREALNVLCKNDICNLLEEFDKHEMRPLHIAAKEGHENIVQTLLSLGARIDAKSDESLTPLHLAAKYGHSRIVQLLLSNVLSIVNDVDDSSNTPLHLAAMEGHVKVVEMLIEAGSAVDTRNAKLMTPLDCAAYRGWNQCAQCLLDADSAVNPTDKVKVTSLHLASKEGHVGIVNLLLSRNADVTRRDHLGKNCLDYAIENNQREVVVAIIGCNNWKNALRNSTVEGNKLTTPMRKLIQKLPDVAEQVFNQCILDNGLPPEHPQFKITCSYEFLEDTFTPWGTIDSDSSENQDNKQLMYSSHQFFLSKISRQIFPMYWMKKKDLKQNHPLKFMVQNERTRLLSHPLVTYLLRRKWSSCGRYVYYSRLLLYMIFLLFITAFALSLKVNYDQLVLRNSTTPILVDLSANSSVKFFIDPSVSPSVKFFIYPGRYFVLVLCLISLGIELVKLLTDPYHYIRIHRVVELAAYICSSIYAFGFFGSIQYVNAQRQLGAASVTLSWLGLVLLLRKFPKLGIYVVMFTHVLKTFTQISPVLFLFIIAFGLGFHLVMFIDKPISYTTPARSLAKVIIGMMGEYEYDTIFNSEGGPYFPSPVTWAMMIMFIIINCILLMNLLIGLAVDNIKGVQKQAVLNRLAMLVDLTLDVEKALPIAVQKRLVKMEESIFPNVHKSWSFWSFWSFESPATNIKKKNTIKNIKKEHKETLLSLRRRMKAIEAQNNRVEDVLNGIINHLNVKQ
ncbi:transient receptor potential cation channel subfamily A member 1 homolog isoform X2 [Hydra vulgaris]|uniref:Transient receptor potential cation channel subfamily A member 1 homolog isoform X2 n=1 Tax=Hydra vulgaris TaxID=6087 RepID=A0ABM4BJN8_HYDVU